MSTVKGEQKFVYFAECEKRSHERIESRNVQFDYNWKLERTDDDSNGDDEAIRDGKSSSKIHLQLFTFPPDVDVPGFAFERAPTVKLNRVITHLIALQKHSESSFH